jgi:hypothetical protein
MSAKTEKNRCVARARQAKTVKQTAAVLRRHPRMGGSVVAVTAVWRQRRWQCGGGAAAAPGWQHCGCGGIFAGVAMAAWQRWQQRGGSGGSVVAVADGQNRNPGILRRSDTRNPRGIPQQSLGVARLRTPMWQVGATKKRGGREGK